VREELDQDVHHELMLGGHPLLDAPIDVIERGGRRVEPALARLRLFAPPPAIERILGLLSKPFLLADGAHSRMPRATVQLSITRIRTIGLSVWMASAACACS
jgi:hypothetical protein